MAEQFDPLHPAVMTSLTRLLILAPEILVPHLVGNQSLQLSDRERLQSVL